MRLICGPESFNPPGGGSALRIILYGQPGATDRGSAGDAAMREVLRQRLDPDPRAWDLLSIALSVVAADYAGLRACSPDGWTREFELEVAVADPTFWRSQASALASALAFLTTDRWSLRFHSGGVLPSSPQDRTEPEEDCVVLLSGGLDSFVGAVDLAAGHHRPIAVSQTVRGDAEKQGQFADRIGAGLRHLQLNHNARVPWTEEPSQRARSLIFLAFGVLTATTLARHRAGEQVTLFVCENGFIAINPPLNGTRLGSLSTRTAHPEFLDRIQRVLDSASLRVCIENPYEAMTKGEMLRDCPDQSLLRNEAARTTSCGRFQRFSYRHCGRCLPCQVRRAAFISWGGRDDTGYVYQNLGKRDREHAGFDDVRSVAMAIAAVDSEGLDAWLSSSLAARSSRDRDALKSLVRRGIDELRELHRGCKVR